MRKIIILLQFAAAGCLAQVPDTLDLLDCHRYAIENHPSFRQKELLEASSGFKIDNLKTSWYPSLDLNGRYTWQNEVVEIGSMIPVPGFDAPLMPHYNYKLTLDIEQTVYDGGMVKSGKMLEERLHEVNNQQLEVDLNGIKEQVNSVYFYILVMQQQEELIQMKLSELRSRLKVVESGIINGTMLPASYELMLAEDLSARQQLSDIQISRATGLSILQKLTGREIPAGSVLLLPGPMAEIQSGSGRPEELLFDLQISSLDASKNLTSMQRRPKAFVFGQFGYGNPAFNFFRNEFRGFYLVGAGLHWNIWDWSKTSRSRQDITIQQEIVATRKDAFDQQLFIQLDEKEADIRRYKKAVEMDRQIVGLREEISRSYSSQLENGVITSTDYITQLNAETAARIRLETHKIQLVQAEINYLTTKGKL